MKTPVTLGLFAAALIVAFAVAYGLGAAVNPLSDNEPRSGHGDHPAASTADASTSDALPGLASSEAGYQLVTGTTTAPKGSDVNFEFTVTDPKGKPLTTYAPTHEKELHLIVVRQDLQHFQHVHPTRTSDGTWTVKLDLPEAGAYRAFADFQPAALRSAIVLGTNLLVAGKFDPVSLAEPTASTRVDDYEISLNGSPAPGRESKLTFTVTKNGREVSDLQPYLGAFGHLVSLREGDLAYLHTHPAEEAHDDDRGGPDVRFLTEFPTEGNYRLFLDFKAGGVVRTAAFTVTVSGATKGTTPEPTAEETSDGHNH